MPSKMKHKSTKLAFGQIIPGVACCTDPKFHAAAKNRWTHLCHRKGYASAIQDEEIYAVTADTDQYRRAGLSEQYNHKRMASLQCDISEL